MGIAISLSFIPMIPGDFSDRENYDFEQVRSIAKVQV